MSVYLYFFCSKSF